MRVALLLLAMAAAAQPTLPFRVLTYWSDIDNSEQPYALYLPEDYDASRRYGLVISLHGAGSNHRNGIRQVFGVSGEGSFPDVPFIVAAPYGRGSMGYMGWAEDDVYRVLDDVKARYSIDPDRVYLTGISMGGSGTLSLALTRPDVWAAIAVLCGGAPDGLPELAGNGLNVPVHWFHGDKDETVPVEVGRDWHKRFEEAGVSVTYKEFAGAGHNIAGLAYANGSIFEWLRRHRRNLNPDVVKFATRSHRNPSAYWVSIDRFRPGELASVEARKSTGKVTVKTSDAISALTLQLGDRPIALEVDGATIAATNIGEIHLSRSDGTWKKSAVALRQQPASPISEVLNGPLAYVYGTAGATGELLWARQQQAQYAADWAGPRGRPNAFARVLADRDVKLSRDDRSSLVLFGTPATNSLLAQYASSLPMQLKPENATEFGLLICIRQAGVCFWFHRGCRGGPARRRSSAKDFAGNGCRSPTVCCGNFRTMSSSAGPSTT